jgi:hypothetical protein
MDKKYYLLGIMLGIIGLLEAQNPEMQGLQVDEPIRLIGCKCYCSDVCSEREARFDDTPEYDEEFGVVFCKKRDKLNYVPHKCHLQPNEDFENCLGKKQLFKKPTAEQISKYSNPVP